MFPVYNEGFANYVASILRPAQATENYFFMNKEQYNSYVDWIDSNRTRIYEDSGRPFKVLDEYHKFYFSTSFNKEYPNIGYIIGYHYFKYMSDKYAVEELQNYWKDEDKNRAEFKDFIFNVPRAPHG